MRKRDGGTCAKWRGRSVVNGKNGGMKEMEKMRRTKLNQKEQRRKRRRVGKCFVCLCWNVNRSFIVVRHITVELSIERVDPIVVFIHSLR